MKKYVEVRIYPVSNEYAWGNQTYTLADANTNGLSNLGQINEQYNGTSMGPINAVPNGSRSMESPFVLVLQQGLVRIAFIPGPPGMG